MINYTDAVLVTSVLILIIGGGMICVLIWKLEPNPYAPHAVQLLGLTFLLPVILVVFATRKVGNEAIIALLGSMVGYLFGSSIPTLPNVPRRGRRDETEAQNSPEEERGSKTPSAKE